MTWLQRYRLRHYVTNSIWILPFLSMMAAIGAVRVLHWIEVTVGWESSPHADTAQAVLGTMASAMFTFIVFVSSALLVAVQLASSQLTPRIIAIVYRDPVTRISLVVFVFTFTFTLAALARVTTTVPPLTTYLAAYGCLASLGVFLFLIDHVGKSLRPSGALWAVAWLGRKVIENVYPMRLAESSAAPAPAPFLGREPTSTVRNCRDGVLLAFDVRGLVSLAERSDCVIELVPQVGDFVAVGDPLFRDFHNGEPRGAGEPPGVSPRVKPLDERSLSDSVAVGQERTLEQDAAFAFRIIVDIASKGLSPAINDPTTGVLALDQIHHLLRNVGNRVLADGRVCDAAGQLRLVYSTPDWEDFVKLAVTEIRQFGATSIQIVRRTRAMLENLIQSVPEDRAVLLRQELDLLDRSSQRFFTEPEDQALADVSDFQGVGSKHGRKDGSRKAKEAKLP
jgi:uncharacterized membrane protein